MQRRVPVLLATGLCLSLWPKLAYAPIGWYESTTIELKKDALPSEVDYSRNMRPGSDGLVPDAKAAFDRIFHVRLRTTYP